MFSAFDPDLISLDMAQRQVCVLHKILMNSLTLSPSSITPPGNGTFIQFEGFDDSLDWTSVCEQHNDNDNELGGLSKSFEHRSRSGGKCFSTHLTAIAFMLRIMHNNRTLPRFPSCQACRIRAKTGDMRLSILFVLSS